MVSPMMKPAADLRRSMDTLSRRVENAAADGTVTRDEKRAINAQVDRVEARAQGMVTHVGAEALEVVGDIRNMSRQQLAQQADRALSIIADGRHAMWREARHDARTNPFRHLSNMRAPFEGVRTKETTFHGKRVQVVAVDLANPRVRLGVTGPGERGNQLDQMARRHHAEVAVNGDFFEFNGHKPVGAARTRGQRWGGDDWEPALAFKGRHAVIKPGSANIPQWAKNAVSARPLVLRDGHVQSSFPEADTAHTARRTGVGVSKSGRVL